MLWTILVVLYVRLESTSSFMTVAIFTCVPFFPRCHLIPPVAISGTLALALPSLKIGSGFCPV
jgi:hypothetical protein